jgi:hypothetical protein
MKQLVIIFSIVILAGLTACQPDPRKQAQAFAIQSKAEQEALNSTQTREQNEAANSIYLQELALQQQHREAAAQEWQAGWNNMIRYGFIFATIGVCIGLLAVAVSFSKASLGIAKATVRLADVRSNLIYLDRTTRQFPAFLQYIGNGKYSLTDINDGSTLFLDTRNEADRQKIQGAMNARYAGVIAEKAQRADDPASMSVIHSPIILEGKDIVDLVRLENDYE